MAVISASDAAAATAAQETFLLATAREQLVQMSHGAGGPAFRLLLVGRADGDVVGKGVLARRSGDGWDVVPLICKTHNLTHVADEC
jgi:hypothetical protein